MSQHDDERYEDFPDGMPSHLPGQMRKLATDRARGTGPATAADCADEPVSWLWRGYLPHGVTGLQGTGGLGKSTMTLDLAARVTEGFPMPDGSPGRQGCVIGISGTEDSGEIIRRRFQAAGGDPMMLIQDGGWEFPRDAKRLLHLVTTYGVPLVIIDPIKSFLQPGLTDKEEMDVRRVLEPLSEVANVGETAILFIRHPRKGSATAADAGSGSAAWFNAVRQELVVGMDPHPLHPDRRVLACSKANLGPAPMSRAFHLDSTPAGVAVVRWDGLSRVTAEQLTMATVKSPRPRDDAIGYLQRTLAFGEKPSAQVAAEGLDLGISEMTLKRARKTLSLTKSKRDGAWWVGLP